VARRRIESLARTMIALALALAATACTRTAPTTASATHAPLPPANVPTTTTSTSAHSATPSDVPRSIAPPPSTIDGPSVAAARTESSSLAADDSRPIELVTVRVPGDRSVLVAPGTGALAIVYLHGRCGDPTAFGAWARAARELGTVVSLRGEVRCRDGERTRWSEDLVGLDRRIDAALRAVARQIAMPVDSAPRIAFGYSQGALRAEALAERFPDRYPRVVLAAGPRGPRPGGLGRARGVLLLGGELDVRAPLVDAARELDERHVRARFLELPGARHGEYGLEAARVLSEGLEWLLEDGPPESDGPASEPELAGRGLDTVRDEPH
jgi:predicted esterase